jgi:hypothetical protein
MIRMIINYFSKEEKYKRKKLREINKKIANSTIYKEIVELSIEYNKIKNEN